MLASKLGESTFQTGFHKCIRIVNEHLKRDRETRPLVSKHRNDVSPGFGIRPPIFQNVLYKWKSTKNYLIVNFID
jgi:hypothetical protein